MDPGAKYGAFVFPSRLWRLYSSATLAGSTAIWGMSAKMNPTAYRAFAIAPGSERLPFAGERQILVYEPETRDLLMQLLERGLRGVPPRSGTSGSPSEATIDVRSWEWEQSQWLQPGATSYRFFTDDWHSDKETAFILWPKIKEASAAWRKGTKDQAWAVLHCVETSFPRLCEKFPAFLRLRIKLAAEKNEREILTSCKANLKKLTIQRKGVAGIPTILMRRWHWSYPLRMRVWKQLIYIWKRKHRIPWKLARILMNLAAGRTRT